MEIRLLGPVEAWSDGVRLDLGPRKQRFVFAVLALETNRYVSVDRLVDLTWPGRARWWARHAIQVNVSRLRAALTTAGTAQLVSEGCCYLLRLSPLDVDAYQFRALIAQARGCARDADRVSLLRGALRLWQGPALVDVGAPEVTDRLTRALTEERLGALEECVGAELRIGHHRAVLGELVDLVAQHAHRQGFVAQLMIAQYRAGHTADALASYRTARTALAVDLGLDPGRRLQELEYAILRGDIGLDLPTIAW